MRAFDENHFSWYVILNLCMLPSDADARRTQGGCADQGQPCGVPCRAPRCSCRRGVLSVDIAHSVLPRSSRIAGELEAPTNSNSAEPRRALHSHVAPQSGWAMPSTRGLLCMATPEVPSISSSCTVILSLLLLGIKGRFKSL
ncbi:hypothetical protein HJG60_011991 [Phyllostomus discolor]|uniref:Uncharacterized protein n=1 Tax=Phyllostomus discolor TaxID=89673 RepID=A0A833ZL72_9CHIR|nr:hypothetical protein HJG60_011991 [Phyllostomus discolor]